MIFVSVVCDLMLVLLELTCCAYCDGIDPASSGIVYALCVSAVVAECTAVVEIPDVAVAESRLYCVDATW